MTLKRPMSDPADKEKGHILFRRRPKFDKVGCEGQIILRAGRFVVLGVRAVFLRPPDAYG